MRPSRICSTTRSPIFPPSRCSSAESGACSASHERWASCPSASSRPRRGSRRSGRADSLPHRSREQRGVALQLQEVLKRGAIKAVYQPVVDLQERRSIGFEALTRLTTGAFAGPDQLFKAAYENDAIWKLERLCRERA